MSRRTVFESQNRTNSSNSSSSRRIKQKLWVRPFPDKLNLDNWYTGEEFNRIQKSKLYKVVHSGMDHFDFKFVPNSINVDSQHRSYYTNPTDSDLLHTNNGDVIGLHFCAAKDLAYWIRYYLHDDNSNPMNFLQIVEVEVPADSVIMAMANQYKASKIYIGSPIKVQDFLANADLTDHNDPSSIAYDHISLMHVFTMLASTSQNSYSILSKILTIQAITDKLKVEPYFNLRYFASSILTRSDNVEAIRIFVEHGVQIAELCSSCALFSAISYNRISVVRWMLSQLDDIDVGICNRALLIASSKGCSLIKQMLLAKHTKS